MYEVDWGAVATLLTGIAAVGSATWVAVRQMHRTHRYFESEQRNREQTVKIELFHLRLDTIKKCRVAFTDFYEHGSNLSATSLASLASASQEAELLFSEDVHDDLYNIYQRFHTARSARERFIQYTKDKEKSDSYADKEDYALDGIELLIDGIMLKMLRQTRPIG
jgi:hypothetical protein